MDRFFLFVTFNFSQCLRNINDEKWENLFHGSWWRVVLSLGISHAPALTKENKFCYRIGSMGLLYLPTNLEFTINIDHSCIGKYTLVPFIWWGIETKQTILTDFCNSQCPPKKKILSGEGIWSYLWPRRGGDSYSIAYRVSESAQLSTSRWVFWVRWWICVAPDTEMGLEHLSIHLTSNVW